MRDASSSDFADACTFDRAPRTWRELYRCDDLRQARAVAACIGAMEFDVRLCSASMKRGEDGEESNRPGPSMPMQASWTGDAIHGSGCHWPAQMMRGVAGDRDHADDELPGPYVVEVPDDTWPQLADVLFEIIAEQQEFDQMIEWRRQRNHVRLVLVLSATTAAEVFLIWRLLEA